MRMWRSGPGRGKLVPGGAPGGQSAGSSAGGGEAAGSRPARGEVAETGDGVRVVPGQDGSARSGQEYRRRGPGRVVRAVVALVALVGMVAFAIVLAGLTLKASPASVPLTHSNLTPGRSIRAYLEQPGFVETVKQLGGNLALGVPFGILLPLLSRRTRGVVRVGLLTVGTMLIVELIQGALITGRAFDVDDVLLNTTGALVGYVAVGRRIGRAVHPRTRRRWWRRHPARPAP
ncbi:VanZ family protein [Streptomyces sp. NPDC002773]|uniref:VanZ family protein n=1 Tax=Streptomyces sp. NPDC002773 TaxID=3154430 RepID=UPI00331A85C8